MGLPELADNRKYEKKLANACAAVYEKAVTAEWAYRYRYFTAHNWGQEFNEPFLDFGCGTGLCSCILEELRKDVISFDVSKEMIKIAKKRCKNVSFVVADALNMPFRDGTFSTACIVGVLHHILNLEKAFDELKRCVRKAVCLNEPCAKTNISLVVRTINSLLFVLERLHNNIIRSNRTYDEHGERYISMFERGLSPEKLIRLCEDHGFRVIYIRYYNHMPFLHKFLSEKTRRRIFSMFISSRKGTDVEIVALAEISRSEKERKFNLTR